jgi:hypothetical protein
LVRLRVRNRNTAWPGDDKQGGEDRDFHHYAERYEPAMRLAGATRAHARGVTDSRIGSDGWFGDSSRHKTANHNGDGSNDGQCKKREVIEDQHNLMYQYSFSGLLTLPDVTPINRRHDDGEYKHETERSAKEKSVFYLLGC